MTNGSGHRDLMLGGNRDFGGQNRTQDKNCLRLLQRAAVTEIHVTGEAKLMDPWSFQE